MSLVVIYEIPGYFVNILTVDDKYSLPNSENLPKPIQLQLSKKRIIFSQSTAPFVKNIRQPTC